MANPIPEAFEAERLLWEEMSPGGRAWMKELADQPEEASRTLTPQMRKFILDNYQRDLDEGILTESTTPHALV